MNVTTRGNGHSRDRDPDLDIEHTDVPEPTETTGSAEPDTDSVPSMRDMVIDSIGGWRGVVDSGLPAVGFVVANIVATLQVAIWTGVAIAVIVFIVRLVRRESIQQAFSGLIGVGICVFIASRTGEARGYFLFGIWRSALLAVVLIGSVVARYPIVGVVWNFLSPSGNDWRSDKRLMQAYNWMTLAWGLSFVLKFAIEAFLYETDSATWLGVVRIGLGYPMTFGLLLLTFVVVRKVRGESSVLALPKRKNLSRRHGAD